MKSLVLKVLITIVGFLSLNSIASAETDLTGIWRGYPGNATFQMVLTNKYYDAASFCIVSTYTFTYRGLVVRGSGTATARDCLNSQVEVIEALDSKKGGLFMGEVQGFRNVIFYNVPIFGLPQNLNLIR